MAAPETPPQRVRSLLSALEPRIERAVRVGLPPGLYIGALLLAYLVMPFDRFVQWAGLLNGYLVLPLGREFTIPLMLSIGYSAVEAVSLVVFVDFVAASFIAWNMHLVRSVPYFGGFVRRAEKSGTRFREKHPSLRAFGLVGLFLWAVKPGRGSGGATSAVLGKLVFVETRWLLPTIVAASLTGCTLVALATETIVQSSGLSLAAAGGALLLAVGLYYLFRIRRELTGRISGALRHDRANMGEE